MTTEQYRPAGCNVTADPESVMEIVHHGLYCREMIPFE